MLVCTMFALPLPSSSATAPVARVLTDLEAAERLKQHGPNRLKPPLQRAVVMSVTLDFVQSAAVPPTAFEVGTRQVGLLIMRLTLLLLAMALPFTGLAPYLGFSPLPLEFFGVLSGLLVCYLLAVEGGTNGFTSV